MNTPDLIDLETYVELRKAQPQVTTVPADIASRLVGILNEYANENPEHSDINDQVYWEAPIAILHEMGNFTPDVRRVTIGTACRLMGLAMERKTDGYHAAWSEAQLKILQNYFKA